MDSYASQGNALGLGVPIRARVEYNSAARISGHCSSVEKGWELISMCYFRNEAIVQAFIVLCLGSSPQFLTETRGSTWYP